MFGLGPTELILIVVIILIIFGPSKLPEMGKSVLRTIVEFRKATQEFESEIKEGLTEPITGDLKDATEGLKEDVEGMTKPLEDDLKKTAKELEEAEKKVEDGVNQEVKGSAASNSSGGKLTSGQTKQKEKEKETGTS
ncbi:MAG: twin-arginine translocase TatA/TatE family subunit [Terriglobia bacterium]